MKTLVIANIAWDFVWQRHQTLASLFARDGEVVFCEVPGIRRVGMRDAARVFARLRALGKSASSGSPPPAGVRVVRPFVLPATNPLFCAVNAALLTRFVRRDVTLASGVDVILNYSPTRSARQLCERVPHRRLVYDCTNDWLTVRGVPASLRADEAWLLNRADLTLVSGESLRARKAPAARRIEIVPEGAWPERFELEPRAADDANGTLTLVYYGHLHRQHFDFALVDAVARLRPQWRLVLIGPVRTPHTFPTNVTLIAQQPHEKLRSFLATADVIFLPYALNDYTAQVFPAKTYECLATSRPIVATPLPGLVAAATGLMEFGATPEEILAAVARALAGNTPERRARMRAVARANTWENRYAKIRELLAALD